MSESLPNRRDPLTRAVITILITISGAWFIWVNASVVSALKDIEKLSDKTTEYKQQLAELKKDISRQTAMLQRLQMDNTIILATLAANGDKNTQKIIKGRRLIESKEE